MELCSTGSVTTMDTAEAACVTSGASSGASSQATSNAGRKRGPCWDHFCTHGDYVPSSKRCAAQCNYCRIVIPATLAKAEELAKHILNVCSAAPDASKRGLQLALAASVPISEKPAPAKKRKQQQQLSITDAFDSVKFSASIHADVKKRYDHTLLRWLVCAGVSFNAVDHPLFLEWVQNIRPQYSPPGMVCSTRVQLMPSWLLAADLSCGFTLQVPATW